MTLKSESFEYGYELCDFVNENKVKVQQIVVDYHTFYLFYWGQEND
jgi:hypothetical protein